MARKRKPTPTETRIISALRKVWRWSKERRQVKEAARFGEAYRCSVCLRLHEKIEIDHLHSLHGLVTRTGNMSDSNWQVYIEKMFCPASDLRAVCRSCHRSITAEQRKAASSKKPKKKAK